MRRLPTLRVLIALVTGTAAALGLWGTSQAQAPQTLVIAIGADQTGLDPHTTLNNESGYIMSAIYDSIAEKQKGTAMPGPGLAESWTVSSDGKVFTFKLRHGVRFHDGTPMNARTVAQDVDRAINPQNPCYVLGRKVDTLDGVTYGVAADHSTPAVDVPDDYTLRFRYAEPKAPFLAQVTMVWEGIVSPAATKQYNCDAGQHPVGTGPFRFVEAVRGDHVTLEANAAYWRGRPKIDRLIFRVVPESTTRQLMLERNQVQMLADVAPADYARIRGDPALQLYSAPGFSNNGVAMSSDVPPFSNRLVRQAMNYAVDKESLNRALYGEAQTSSQASPPVDPGYDPAIKPYPYDPAKAQALLREAGYPDGFSAEMYVYSNPRGYNPVGGARVGEAVQAYLAKVGVRVAITQYEWGAYLDKIRHTPWRGLALWGKSGLSGDPEEFPNNLFGFDETRRAYLTMNAPRYRNQRLDALLMQGRQLVDPVKRLALYHQANRIVHDDAPWIFLTYVNQVKAARASVKGFVLSAEPYFFHMEDVSLQLP